jgi:hypothetical protein
VRGFVGDVETVVLEEVAAGAGWKSLIVGKVKVKVEVEVEVAILTPVSAKLVGLTTGITVGETGFKVEVEVEKCYLRGLLVPQ